MDEDKNRLEYEKFNVSSEVMGVMLLAKGICNELGEYDVTAADFIIACLSLDNTKLYKFLSKDGEYVDTPDSIVADILTNKELYKKITGISYSEYLEYKKDINSGDFIVKDENGNQLDIDTVILNYSFFTDYSEELQNAFIKAKELEKANGSDIVQIDTLILSVLSNRSSKANTTLRQFFPTTGLVPYLRKNTIGAKNVEILSDPLPAELKSYVTNLNIQYAKEGKCNILGRDDEIFDLWNVISKRIKRNAILLGLGGVGKSAIVEAITHSIIDKTCPKRFENYTVYSLDITAMISGTKYRGEFEEKVQRFIQFVEKTKNIIIFVDEIHHMRGAGTNEDSGPDLAGSLKPILARGDVALIGATTNKEYDRIISKDDAFSRRFETILVKEPKFNEVKPMIRAQVESLSKFHDVEVSEQMLDKVQICASSFENIANPDKTLTTLDRCMAVAKMSKSKELKFEHIERAYKKNFDLYKKTPMAIKRSTAYHEAGHCAAWILSKTKENSDLILVSIIPAKWWAGVNCFEENEVKQYERDINYFKESIGISLAGRIAQSFVTNKINTGASVDLQHATQLVEDYILKYGLDDEYINYSFDTDSNLDISNEMTDNIRKRAKDFINKVYKETEELLIANRKSIDNIAELLLEKGIITKKEALKAFYKDREKPTRKTSKKTAKTKVNH